MREAAMKKSEFRQELMKIMPGYKWTVSQSKSSNVSAARGTMSAGFNRLSTLLVICRQNSDGCTYEVTSSGYGVKANWVGENTDLTLARALRGLQEGYERKASFYGSLASKLQAGRTPTERGGVGVRILQENAAACPPASPPSEAPEGTQE
jgi:hypothetical protein